ncbi:MULTISPECIES: TRAP transporter small permease [Pseudomonadota]|uniref:TRAP transporter small permease n=1 Tax=Pseudomonadota TaxID=1224 RepID=UPI000C4AA6B3|nr:MULTISPECIES: TRAP transporter small permease subunit [Pseudomonadota]MAZ01783.1 hypothetical protein [Sneathiella sp.]CAH1387943.1 conserved membrane hypothetical protein [Candidatus Nitrotoga sp. M5]
MSEKVHGEKIVNWVVTALCVVAAVVVLLMTGHVLVYVVSRFLKLFSLFGTIEIIANFYMVAIVFLPIGLLVSGRGEELISVTFFTQKLSEKASRVVLRFGQILTLSYLCVLAAGAIRKLFNSWHDHEVVDIVFGFIDLWPSRLVAAVGLLVAFIVMIWAIYAFSFRSHMIRNQENELYH